MYKHMRKRENYGSGEIPRLGTGVVHYLGIKLLLVYIQRFSKGPGIVISLIYSTLIFNLLYGSHTIANTINLHGESP